MSADLQSDSASSLHHPLSPEVLLLGFLLLPLPKGAFSFLLITLQLLSRQGIDTIF